MTDWERMRRQRDSYREQMRQWRAAALMAFAIIIVGCVLVSEMLLVSVR